MIRQPSTEIYSSTPAPYNRASGPTARPAVSVSIITYNQRGLIGRAIDSVVAQRVDFDYEIIIGDDCSDDGTQDVLREYQRRYPDRIQLILHPRRYRNEVPGRTNNTTNLLNCRGKYTAMLDGDDYWTDPDKLQRQYDLMETYPELAMCLHDVSFAYAPDFTGPKRDFERLSGDLNHLTTGRYTHEDIAMRTILHPHIGSLLFRTALRGPLPDWFYSVVAADFALLLYLSSKGPVYYEHKVAGVYYINANGFQQVYRRKYWILQQLLQDIDIYREHFPATTQSHLGTNGKAYLHWHLGRHERDQGRFVVALHHLVSVFKHDILFGLRMLFKPPPRMVNFLRTYLR